MSLDDDGHDSIERANLATIVVARIRHRIITGLHEPGSKINEADLS